MVSLNPESYGGKRIIGRRGTGGLNGRICTCFSALHHGTPSGLCAMGSSSSHRIAPLIAHSGNRELGKLLKVKNIPFLLESFCSELAEASGSTN